MREGIMFGVRILGKYFVMLLLSLMFLGMIPREQLWLQAILNAAILAGFALLTLNEAGTLGERAETLRVSLDARRKEGSPVDPSLEAKSYRPSIAFTGFLVAALPLFIIALLNLASLPSHPESLDPSNFAAVEEALPEEGTLPAESTLPEAAAQDAAEATPAPEAEPAAPEAEPAAPEAEPAAPEAEPAAPDAEPAVPEVRLNIFNTIARVAFSPFIALYGLLSEQLLALYVLMALLSFFLPAFALAGYLGGPKLREKKLEAIKKGIRAKKRKEKRARKPSGPKPEV